MPNRIIKESINESKGLSEVSIFAEDLYKRLIVYADDYGRFNADYQIMRARLYPREIEIVSESDIEDALIELSGAGKIAFYTSSARKETYGCLPKWKEHQRIRESKSKCPEPDDTSINDYYLRRFVPIKLKRAIIERDGFKCVLCGKYISSVENADALIKLGAGLFHIDHIVPVSQGGRSTMENLRLTCPKCNLERKKKYKAEELIATECGNPPQDAASCGKVPLESNPLQSESKSNPNICSELPAAAEPEETPVITLILNTKKEYPFYQKDVDEWSELYPAVDVMQELRTMKGWCINNPKKRKTAGGIRRFVNSWLASEQDKGGKRPQASNAAGKKNSFHNFTERSNDYEELQRELVKKALQ